MGAGLEDAVLSCGVECMSRVPLGANFADKKLGRPVPKSYFERFAFKSQFQGAELIAEEYGITREDTDRFGLRSQELAGKAWGEGRFEREIVPVEAPLVDEERQPTGETASVSRAARSQLKSRARANPRFDRSRRRSSSSSSRRIASRTSSP